MVYEPAYWTVTTEHEKITFKRLVAHDTFLEGWDDEEGPRTFIPFSKIWEWVAVPNPPQSTDDPWGLSAKT